jgi:hypothetical protein
LHEVVCVKVEVGTFSRRSEQPSVVRG